MGGGAGLKQGEEPDIALGIMREEREWIYAKLNEDDVKYPANLPEELNLEYQGVRIHAFHAAPDSLFEVVPPIANDEILSEKLMKKQAIGSIGLPFDGMGKASYMILDIDKNGYQTSIVRVDSNTDEVIEQFNQPDYPNKECMMKVLRNGSM